MRGAEIGDQLRRNLKCALLGGGGGRGEGTEEVPTGKHEQKKHKGENVKVDPATQGYGSRREPPVCPKLGLILFLWPI